MSLATAPAMAESNHEFDQAGLFELTPASESFGLFSDDERRNAGKRVVQKLLQVRRQLSAVESTEYYAEISELIDRIRRKTSVSNQKREELVLYSIEQSGACTPSEIAEDTKIPRNIVDEIIHSLAMRQVIYQTRRYVPGSDRPQFMIKSSRSKTPEATDVIFHRAHTYDAWESDF